MSDPECTDCGGTGLTYQTERLCSCQTLLQRLRQYEGQSFETTACYNGLRDEAAATIERLTKDLDEARLQDSNQWRREYWKHYNDLKARADSLAAELAKANERAAAAVDDYNDVLAELAKAREALERAGRALDMAAGFAERGQYPVSAFEYRKAASDARAALPERNARAKLSEDDVSRTAVSDILCGRRWAGSATPEPQT